MVLILITFSLDFKLMLLGETSCWSLTVPRMFAVRGVDCVVNLRQTLSVHLVSTFEGCLFYWEVRHRLYTALSFLLKLKRQRAQQIAKRVKLLQDMERAHFAKETVSSILKKAPPVDWADKPKTPPRTPTKEGPRTPERVSQHDTAYVSPRTQRRDCERQVILLYWKHHCLL